MKLHFKHLTITPSDKTILEQLLALSKAWADEACCPSYICNDSSEYIDQTVYLALDDQTIIGYALGELRRLEEKTSYNQIGEMVFELNELFIASDYRQQGIGQQLYRYLEDHLPPKTDLIAVIATSIHHRKLLDFYLEDLGFGFRYALLTKRP